MTRLEILEDRTVPSTLTVTNNLDKGAGSLRDAITNAKSGDTIVFAPSLAGQTITLTSDQLTISRSLDIEGPGASLLAISGNDQNRIFNINEGFSLMINGLTLTHGLSKAIGDNGHAVGGGAILNAGSTLTLANDVLSYNQADLRGGAISNHHSGSLTVTHSTFLGNQARNPFFAEGGAIYSVRDFPNVTVIGCTFTDNQAIGGNGGALPTGQLALGAAAGGALHVEGPASNLTVIDSTFTGNQAIGGSGGSAPKGSTIGIYDIGTADGGAIVCHDGGNLVLSGSTFTNNAAVGGSNASGASVASGWLGAATGGAMHCQGATTITTSSFLGNAAVGGSGNIAGSGTILVGGGDGGAIYKDAFVSSASPLSVSNSTFTNNQAIGGAGNAGGIFAGDGIGGGIMTVHFGQAAATVTATVTGTTFSGNQAIGGVGGAAGNGADGLGGALANVLGATLTVSGCVLSGNQAVGGAGAAGGLYNDGQSTLTVTTSTITANQATGGVAGSGGSVGQGIGGGVYFATGGIVCLDLYTVAHIFANIASTSNNDVFGFFTIC